MCKGLDDVSRCFSWFPFSIRPHPDRFGSFFLGTFYCVSVRLVPSCRGFRSQIHGCHLCPGHIIIVMGALAREHLSFKRYLTGCARFSAI